MANQQIAAHPAFIKIDSVSSQVGLGKSTLLAWESTGRFPRAVRLSANIRVWLQQDIDDWVREQHEKSTTPDLGSLPQISEKHSDEPKGEK